jgi:DNA polymerase-1
VATVSKRVVLDIETDSLTPTLVHCIVTKDIDTNELKKYHGDFTKFLEDAASYDTIIGHNILSFDLPALTSLIGWSYSGEVIDTLILSRLFKYDITNGHSLEAWGPRLNHPKMEFHEFDTYSDLMLTYCVNDVELNHKVYTFLWSKVGTWTDAVRVEHETQRILNDTKRGGFPFDMKKMETLRDEIVKRVEELDGLITKEFPPKFYSLGEYRPRLTKHGTISRSNLRWWEGSDFSVFADDCSFVRLGVEHFNPGSVKQIVTRLTDNGWWDPVERTNGYIEAQRSRDKAKMSKLQKYGWKVNENNLATLKDTAPSGAKYLVERLALGSRLSTFDQWIKAYDPTTASIHGTINGIGTWTHRCSHTNPNLANIAAKKSIKYKEVNLARKITELGGRMRDLFHCGGWDDSHWLVGTDAEGIQLRLFSHYTNDIALIKANVEGNKDLGTDIHSLNKRALGAVCKTRDDAKTWIYAYLLGAGLPKLGSILGCNQAESKRALDNLLKTYKSIEQLRREQIPRDAARGYFQGIDGRLVICSSEHLMLAGYLQNGEVLVMKHAMMQWHKEVKALGIEFRLVNFVHDEWQTVVTGGRMEAEKVASVQRDAIKWAGEQLDIRCPLAGSSVIGKTWLDTH